MERTGLSALDSVGDKCVEVNFLRAGDYCDPQIHGTEAAKPMQRCG